MIGNVIETPGLTDLGIDMRVELFNGEFPSGIHFNIQCKGSENIKVDNDISIQIKVETINYWLQQREPTFLMVVDTTNDEFYWSYPFEQIKNLEEMQKQKTVTIKINKNNVCSKQLEKLPKEMMQCISEYQYDVLEKIVSTLTNLEVEIEQEKKGEQILNKLAQMNAAVNRILRSVEVVQELNNSVKHKVKTIIDSEIDSCLKSMGALDHIVEAKKYLRTNSIEQEDFSGRVPIKVLDKLKIHLDSYLLESSSENLKQLNETLIDLIELNGDLNGFLKEMLDEEKYGEWHPYDYL